MNRDSFVFYASFYEAIKELPRDIQGDVYTAVIEYGLYGKLTDNLKPIAKAMFTLIKPQLDANYQRYENGKKGGRPPQKETKKKPKRNQTITKVEPNVNDNVNVNVNDNDIKEKDTNVSEKKEEVSSSHPLETDFDKFNVWIKENAHYCSDTKNFPKQIDEKAFTALKQLYTGSQIAEIILQIENRKDLRKRYTDLHRTVLNWAKKEYGK